MYDGVRSCVKIQTFHSCDSLISVINGGKVKQILQYNNPFCYHIDLISFKLKFIFPDQCVPKLLTIKVRY